MAGQSAARVHDGEHGEVAAGSVRALVRAQLLNPAYPRLKFFRPKIRLPIQKPVGRYDLRPLAFPYLANCMAGVLLFASYSTAFRLAHTLHEEVHSIAVDDDRLDLIASSAAGMVAGAAHGLVAHPAEVLQQRHAVVSPSHVWHTMTSPLLRAEALSSLHLTLLRDSFGFGLFFFTYEKCRSVAHFDRGRDQSTRTHAFGSVLATVAAGAAATTAHHLVSFPSDALQRHMAAAGAREASTSAGTRTSTFTHAGRTASPPNRHSLVRVLCGCLELRGALFHGIGASLLRALPWGCASFLAFEAMLTPATLSVLGSEVAAAMAGAARAASNVSGASVARRP